MPLWLNTSFAEKERPSLELFNTEITEVGDFLSLLGGYKNKLSSVSLNGFSDPSTFFKHWHNFQQNILSYFLDDTENGFKSSFCEANALGKRVAISIIESLVDTFDTIIKSVTGSQQFLVVDDFSRQESHRLIAEDSTKTIHRVQIKKDKVFTFYFMLHSYMHLLKQLYKLLLALGLSLAPFGNNSAADILDSVIKNLTMERRSNGNAQLKIKPNFNILSNALGSGANTCSLAHTGTF